MSRYNDGYMYQATPKQHLKFNSKLSNTEAELEKSVAYKKSVYIKILVLFISIGKENIAKF